MISARRKKGLSAYRQGSLSRFMGSGPVLEIGAIDPVVDADSQDTILCAYRLQDIGDYRAALQRWFGAVRDGGHLIVVVPHAFLYERTLELPSQWSPGQRRLYTPALLMAEVEESLAPNSYRVRHLSDDDDGYDYTIPMDVEATGASDVLLALQKMAPPQWTLTEPLETVASTPDYAFERSRTRVEVAVHPDRRKILILKLDHMGDFIMGISALEKARKLFSDAEITLVVGSWNVQSARELGVADTVIAFDAFPRNSSEQEVDVHANAALFRSLIVDEYDLAIDLRTDVDTRTLLRQTRAKLRAGIGTAAQFPYLDIFLPVDFNRNEPETAREHRYSMHDFTTQGPIKRIDYRLIFKADEVERDWAILWGPYHRLRPGRYFFEPFLELTGEEEGGLLLIDIALNTKRAVYTTLPRTEKVRLPFVVHKDNTQFEFRIWTVGDAPAIDFSFFGGRLVREGAGSTLHQAEYTNLLIDLIALRIERTGVLVDALTT